jgi:hypothetical protein
VGKNGFHWFISYTSRRLVKSKIIDRRIEKGMNYLYENQLPSGWGNALYTALASVSLINMNYKGNVLEKAVEHILIIGEKMKAGESPDKTQNAMTAYSKEGKHIWNRHNF